MAKINLNTGWKLQDEYESPEAAKKWAAQANKMAENNGNKWEFVAVLRDGKFEVYWRDMTKVEAEVL